MTAAAYRTWITEFAAGIGTRRAAVILEPDALADIGCLTAEGRRQRLELLRFAVEAFAATGTVAVYIDAGHFGWHPPATIAALLTEAGIASARGFALNVANFVATADNLRYGEQVSALVGGRHFVIDTGRNGRGPAPNAEWCNPAGRALGDRPTTNTGHPLADAFLWVKTPGESDGACAGAPVSGIWMPEYALGLAQRAAW
jgi:endoglucanase